jgi:DNA-binding MarR family transcriptional regulator
VPWGTGGSVSAPIGVETDIGALRLDSKELFLLAEIDEHPYPAELATAMSMPKATVTVYLKRLEAAGFVRPHIDPADLRRRPGVKQSKMASRSYRTRSASVRNACPQRSKTGSRTC